MICQLLLVLFLSLDDRIAWGKRMLRSAFVAESPTRRAETYEDGPPWTSAAALYVYAAIHV